MNTPFLYVKLGAVGTLAIAYLIVNRSALRTHQPQAVTGVVKAVDRERRQLTLHHSDGYQPSEFGWSEETACYDNEKAISEDVIQHGHRVRVSYSGKRGAWLATKIEVDAVCPATEPLVVSGIT
jgi:Cu/Ag efflux protein CusF